MRAPSRSPRRRRIPRSGTAVRPLRRAACRTARSISPWPPQAVHWFDLARYYAEVRRVARPAGVLALVTYGLVQVDDDAAPLVQHFFSAVLGPYWPPERRYVDDGYRSLPFPFEEITAPPLEIRAAWTLANFVGYVETVSAVRALERARGPAPLAEFRREGAGACGPQGPPPPGRRPPPPRGGGGGGTRPPAASTFRPAHNARRAP